MAVVSTDLTGRSEGYRGVAIRCPGCAESMRQLGLTEAEAEVDVCDACGGVWVDWFDGELRAIAAETQKVRDEGQRSAPGGVSGDKRIPNEAAAHGACPRCTRQLVPERYEIKAEVASARIEGRTSVVGGRTGAELLRCEDCMGSFVSRTSAEILSFLSASDDPPASRAAVDLKPLPWERFVALLKSIFGAKKDAKGA
jgi:Zn-finger nucleic acid-binding protein